MTNGGARRLFVDTSAFYARLDPSDQWHQLAMAGFVELANLRAALLTSNLVIAETHQLAYQRLGFPAARDWLSLLSGFNLRFQTEEEHRRATQILASPIGQSLSYVDAALMASMEARGVETVFSFDSDFALGGFTLFPGDFSSPYRMGR